MAKLRAYELNGGDMLELVRYQKRNLPKAVGTEYEVLSSTEIIQSEKNRHGELGKYVDSISHCLIFYPRIVGELCTIISEGKFTQSFTCFIFEIEKKK